MLLLVAIVSDYYRCTNCGAGTINNISMVESDICQTESDTIYKETWPNRSLKNLHLDLNLENVQAYIKKERIRSEKRSFTKETDKAEFLIEEDQSS